VDQFINSVLSGAFLDNLVTWLAHKLGLVTITMWGIQFVGTFPERILLLILCSFVMATTLAVADRARSPQWRVFILIVGAFVWFRGLYAIFPRDYSGDVALFLTLLFTIIHLPEWRPVSNTAGNLLRFGKVRLLLSTILVPALAVLLV